MSALKKLTLIFVLLVGGRAYAQPGDQPAGEADKASEARKAATEEDPSRHFNFFSFDYKGKDELGGPMGDGKMVVKDANGNVVRVLDEEEPMSAPFLFVLINFGLLLIILGKWGWPTARKLAADRHDQIKVALDEAAKLRDQAQKKLTEYETRIKDMDAEIAKLVAGIRADAEADKTRILAAAEATAAQMKKDAELRIAAEIELARAQLTQEVTNAAATAAEKLLRDKTTADDQKKLVATFIADVEKSKEARP